MWRNKSNDRLFLWKSHSVWWRAWVKSKNGGYYTHCECRHYNNIVWWPTLWWPIKIHLHHCASGFAPANEIRQHKCCHFRLVSYEKVVPPRPSQPIHADIDVTLLSWKVNKFKLNLNFSKLTCKSGAGSTPTGTIIVLASSSI